MSPRARGQLWLRIQRENLGTHRVYLPFGLRRGEFSLPSEDLAIIALTNAGPSAPETLDRRLWTLVQYGPVREDWGVSTRRYCPAEVSSRARWLGKHPGQPSEHR